MIKHWYKLNNNCSVIKAEILIIKKAAKIVKKNGPISTASSGDKKDINWEEKKG